MIRDYETTFLNLAIIYLLILLVAVTYIINKYIIIDGTIIGILLFILSILGALLAELTILTYNKITRKMEEKTIKVNIPEGYEIDKEKSTFENIVLKPIRKIKTWDDLMHIPTKGKYYIDATSGIKEITSNTLILESRDRNLLPNKEYAEAMLALSQLLLVRSYYIKDWEQNPKDKSYAVFVKYDYNAKKDVVDWEFTGSTYRTLSFPNSEMAQAFIINNRKLIIKAKLVL